MHSMRPLSHHSTNKPQVHISVCGVWKPFKQVNLVSKIKEKLVAAEVLVKNTEIDGSIGSLIDVPNYDWWLNFAKYSTREHNWLKCWPILPGIESKATFLVTSGFSTSRVGQTRHHRQHHECCGCLGYSSDVQLLRICVSIFAIYWCWIP